MRGVLAPPPPPAISKPDEAFLSLGIEFVDSREGIKITELNELFEKARVSREAALTPPPPSLGGRWTSAHPQHTPSQPPPPTPTPTTSTHHHHCR